MLPNFKLVLQEFRKRLDVEVVGTLFQAEQTFRVSVVVELFFQMLPQFFIIGVSNYYTQGWDGFSVFLFMLVLIVGLKDIGFLSKFLVSKFLMRTAEERALVLMRPMIEQHSKIDHFFDIKSYIVDPVKLDVDEQGNTTLHHLTQNNFEG